MIDATVENLGVEASGTVLKVGDAVTDFKVGDRVVTFMNGVRMLKGVSIS